MSAAEVNDALREDILSEAGRRTAAYLDAANRGLGTRYPQAYACVHPAEGGAFVSVDVWVTDDEAGL